MDVKGVVRRVRESSGDINVLQYSNDTITDWINDAVRECVIENGLLQATARTETSVGQHVYGIPSDILRLHSIRVDGRKVTIQTLEQWEALNDESENPEDQMGSPTHAYVYAGLLNLFPVPDKEVSLVINYTKLPPEINYTPDPQGWSPNELPIPENFHNRIVTYCLAQVALQDDDFNKYQLLMQEFLTGVRNLQVNNNTEDDLYPFISVSPRDMGY